LKGPVIVFLYCMISSGSFCQASSRLGNTAGKFGDFGQYGMQSLNIGSNSISTISTAQTTKGKRFFFDEWVRGSVTAISGEKINTEDFYFNFDKVNNRLIVSKDKKEVIEVNSEYIREIHFINKEMTYDFVKEEKIDSLRFLERLQKNDRLSLYKTINTKFVKANFATDGLSVTGNPYDEFVDAPTYFICYKGEFRPVSLKFSSIKKALKEESKKVIDFYVDHLNDEVDENYLVNLVIYLNK
jgi:hypothetical protein